MMWQGTVEVVNYTRGHCFLDCTGSVDTWRFRRWLQEFCHFLPLFLSSPVPTLPSVLGRFHCSNCKSEDDVPFKCPLCDFTCCKTCWEQFLKVLLFIGLVWFFPKLPGSFVLFRRMMWTSLESEFFHFQKEHPNADGRFTTCSIISHGLQCDWRQISVLIWGFYTFASFWAASMCFPV